MTTVRYWIRYFAIGWILILSLVISSCGSSDGPVAVCGPNGVERIQRPSADNVLVVCKNGKVYEVLVS